MKQLLRPEIGIQLDQWRHRRMAEPRIGFLAKAPQRFKRDRRADEGLHHPRGEFRIGEAPQRPKIGGGEMRPGFGDIEAAILGEAGEEDGGEIRGGGAAAGGDVTHVQNLRSFPPPCQSGDHKGPSPQPTPSGRGRNSSPRSWVGSYHFDCTHR